MLRPSDAIQCYYLVLLSSSNVQSYFLVLQFSATSYRFLLHQSDDLQQVTHRIFRVCLFCFKYSLLHIINNHNIDGYTTLLKITTDCLFVFVFVFVFCSLRSIQMSIFLDLFKKNSFLTIYIHISKGRNFCSYSRKTHFRFSSQICEDIFIACPILSTSRQIYILRTSHMYMSRLQPFLSNREDR